MVIMFFSFSMSVVITYVLQFYYVCGHYLCSSLFVLCGHYIIMFFGAGMSVVITCVLQC